MHTISQVAERFGLTLRALRFYEDKGLISPKREGARRLYSDFDVERVAQIALWSAAGVPLKTVKMALKHLDDYRARACEVLILDTVRQEHIKAEVQRKAIARIMAFGAFSTNPSSGVEQKG